jgi:hypothetical protein
MPDPKEIAIPKVGRLGTVIGFPEGEVLKGGQLAFALVVSTQGRTTGSRLAADLVAEASLKNQLGTARPPRLVAVSDAEDKNIIYFIPSMTEVGAESVKIHYYRNSFRLSLFRLFAGLSLIPPVGQRDIYTIKVSEEPIITPTITGYGLVLKVDARVSEPIRVSEVTRMRRANKLLERKVREDEQRRLEQAKTDEHNAKLAGSNIPS